MKEVWGGSLSFSYADHLLKNAPEKPKGLDVDDNIQELARTLGRNPHEMEHLLVTAIKDADDEVLRHHWNKLLTVVKLRDQGALRAHMEQVAELQAQHDKALLAWKASVENLRQELQVQQATMEREADNHWQVTLRDYGRFEKRLLNGVFIGDISEDEAELIKALQKHHTDLGFRKYMGWRGRKVQLVGHLPTLDMDAPWYYLARAIARK